MTCEHATQLLPDYFEGALAPGASHELNQHLEQCASCKETVVLWNELGLLPEETPSAVLHARVDAMARAFHESMAPRKVVARPSRGFASWLGISWIKIAPAAVAFTALLLAVGFYAGRSANHPSSTPQDEIASMHAELTNMRQLVILSMLQQQSASERLQGVSYTDQEQQLDPKIVSALLHTLRSDSSVDVRIAALNALSRNGAQPQVRQGLIEALQPQQSPLVQVALIDQLVDLHDRAAVQQIEKMRDQPDVNPAVRQRAEWALTKF